MGRTYRQQVCRDHEQTGTGHAEVYNQGAYRRYAEVAIKAVEAVFDWRAYLKEEGLAWMYLWQKRKNHGSSFEELLKMGKRSWRDPESQKPGWMPGSFWNT